MLDKIKSNKQIWLRWLTVGVSLYMVMGFGWWTVLLVRQNDYTFDMQMKAMKVTAIAQNNFNVPPAAFQRWRIEDSLSFIQIPVYQQVVRDYERRRRMIWGEGAVIMAILLMGIWFTNESYNRQMNLANQRRNFLLSITHELKSPLASMQLVLDTFKKRQLSPEQTQKLANNGLKEAERLNELVTNMLLSARLEQQYVPDFEELNVRNLLDEIVNRLQLKLVKANILLRHTEVPILRGDKSGLISVFTNLIENAVKYGDPTTPTIEIKYNMNKDKIIFDFIDNGIGIPDAEKTKVFERFYRIGSEDRRTTKGTGLGLYIVAQIVKAHRGTIHLLNNKPKGSIFRITLPIFQK
jgi:signal transduction histidine kinase